MNEEYKMLRDEANESIAKQDTLTNIVFTVLGASSIYSTLNENIPFIILIELISAVLLARILHYRHVVLYLSTYLERKEKTLANCDIHWESNLRCFHHLIPTKYRVWGFLGKILWNIVKIARATKHFGNLILSVYLFSPVFPKLKELCIISEKCLTINYEAFFALIALILNIVFSLGICFLYKLRPGYTSVWEDILPSLESN